MNRGIAMRVRARQNQTGVSLVSAIFLIVVLAAIAAFSVRLGALQQQTVNANLRAAQAFHAAKSGIAWGAYRAVGAGWCGTTTLNLAEGGANGFAVAVSCVQTSHVEAGAAINVYTIYVLAEAGSYGGPDYVSRRMRAKVTDAG